MSIDMINNSLDAHITKTEFLLTLYVIYFALIILIIIFGQNGQKVLVDGGVIKHYKLKNGNYKEIESIPLNDIDYIEGKIFYPLYYSEGDYPTYTTKIYYLIDKTNRQRLRIGAGTILSPDKIRFSKLSFMNKQGKYLVDYLKEELGLEVREILTQQSIRLAKINRIRKVSIIVSIILIIGIFIWLKYFI